MVVVPFVAADCITYVLDKPIKENYDVLLSGYCTDNVLFIRGVSHHCCRLAGCRGPTY